MTSDPSWEEIQDRQISDSLKQIDGHDDDESPVVRLMSFSDDLIGEKHLTNAIAVFRRTQDFSVFDVGFGRGRLLAQIGGHFPNARLGGVDDNDDSLERARLLVPRADLVKGPYRSAGGQHDFVVCSQVYEHVADTEDLLDALFDLTRPGGYISLSTPSGWTYRRPRLGNIYHAVSNWDFYWRVRLNPEKNWAMALPHHPSIQPSKLIRRIEARGGEIVARRSAMWLTRVGSPLFRVCNAVGGVRGALLARSILVLLDAAMNAIPGMFIFESQFVLLVRKPLAP